MHVSGLTLLTVTELASDCMFSCVRLLGAPFVNKVLCLINKFVVVVDKEV
jgi:hypothetical protein